MAVTDRSLCHYSSLSDLKVAYAMKEERNADAGIDMSVNAHDMRYSR